MGYKKKTGHKLDLAVCWPPAHVWTFMWERNKNLYQRIRKAFATNGYSRDKAKRKGLLVLVVFPSCPYHVAPILWWVCRYLNQWLPALACITLMNFTSQCHVGQYLTTFFFLKLWLPQWTPTITNVNAGWWKGANWLLHASTDQLSHTTRAATPFQSPGLFVCGSP